MKIGVMAEIKAWENRVALTPAGAEVLGDDGHEVWVQHGAGEGSGFEDAQYVAATNAKYPTGNLYIRYCEYINVVS